MSTDVRTLQIGSSWFPEQSGGLERYYYDLFNRLPDYNFSSRGLVIGKQEIFDETNNKVVAFSEKFTPLLQRWVNARRAIKYNIKEFRPELICVHFALYGFPAVDLISKIPLVIHFQGPWALEAAMEKGASKPSAIKYYIERSVYRHASHFLVLSEAFKNILIQHYRISSEKISVVPGAIDASRFDVSETKSEARRRLNWPNDRPILFSVRRLSKRMGLENLLVAIAQVKKSYPDILLFIAGKGNLAFEIEKMINELDLNDNVRLLGFISDDDLPVAYRAADFSVVPTTSLEGFGLITAESLAAGTAALVTPVGGLPEIILPFDKNWVTENYGSAAIANSIGDILSGNIKIPSGESCKQYARRYDWHTVIPKISDIYRGTLS